MGRNLYILAGTLAFFALAAFAVSFTNVAQQPGSPGDTMLWRTMAIAFLCQLVRAGRTPGRRATPGSPQALKRFVAGVDPARRKRWPPTYNGPWACSSAAQKGIRSDV